MTVIATLDLRLKMDSIDRAHEVLKDILVDTRGFAGCQGVDVLIDDADPAHITLLERWESPEQDAAYREWRATEAGAPAGLGALLAGPPVLTKFTKSSEI